MRNNFKAKIVSAIVLMVVLCQICVMPDIIRAEKRITYLESEKVLSLRKMNIPSKGSKIFESTNLENICTKYDMNLLYNICSGQISTLIPEDDNEKYVTQGELVGCFLSLFRFDATDDAIEMAKSAGLIEINDGFVSDESSATYYNLACLTYNCIVYDPSSDDGSGELPVFKRLLENRLLDGLGFDGIQALGNEAMLNTLLYGVKKYPYTTMKGGRDEELDFGYVNYFGSTLYRPYFSQQQWSRDGKSFICSIRHNQENKFYMYVYNIETQTFRYIDTINQYFCCVMGDDDFVYYIQSDNNGTYDLWKSPIDGSGAPQQLYCFPGPMWVSMLHISNDGRYASVELGKSKESAKFYDYPEGTTPILLIDIEEKTTELAYYSYNYSNTINHLQINPEYKDLIFFAHETNTDKGFLYTDIQERSNIMNMETGDIISIDPGLVEDSDRCMILLSHETWSYNGEYLYITNLGGYGENVPMNGIVRVDKDGTHRRFFYNYLIRETNYNGWNLGINHSYPSGDDRYFAIDGNWVYLMSAETNQVFPICQTPFAVMDHPYHPHPVIARHKYIMNWGMQSNDGVLGISWYDFTDIDKTAIAIGGRCEFGNHVKNVRYHEKRSYAPKLLCDTRETTFNGKTALYAEKGKNIYLDINENIVDAENAGVKISFEYYDNSTSPIILTYTKGVEEKNDRCYFENMIREIQRTGTGEWKKADVTIECGNFENIGTYGTDFYITGKNEDVYIANVEVENLDTPVKVSFSSLSEENNIYNFRGILSRTESTVVNAKVIAATYGENGSLINVVSQETNYGSDSVASFNLSMPRNGGESEVRFFVWDVKNLLIPLSDKIQLASFELTATSAANGVRLEWETVSGAESYEVYRDGKRIAITEQTVFEDKYFVVPEQLEGDIMKEYTKPHSYIVRAQNSMSNSVSGSIDKSLIKYVISPTDMIIDFGDTEADEYVAIVCVNATNTEESRLFSVCTDNIGTMKDVPYFDINEEIKVFSAFMGRYKGVSYKPKISGYFNVPENFVNQKFYAYVFKIKACFNNAGKNNLSLPENDGITINSIAFVKAENFIY